jgi:hypothetical protein
VFVVISLENPSGENKRTIKREDRGFDALPFYSLETKV